MKRIMTGNPLVMDPGELAEGAVAGKIDRIDGAGQCIVDFPGNGRGPIPARMTRTAREAIRAGGTPDGREVLLVFEGGDPARPVVVDALYPVIGEMPESKADQLSAEKPEEVLVDGKRIVYEAQNEIVLRCGKSSITLTRAGKVLIRGAYLLSRSSGVNRIKGGSVQIN